MRRREGWQAPNEDSYVLNVDATLGDEKQAVGCGGVLRDKHGKWSGGFACTYPASIIEECEAWAILKGLEWAWHHSIRKL